MAGVVLIAIDSSPQAEAAFECKQKLHVFNLLATVLYTQKKKGTEIVHIGVLFACP